MKKNDDMIDEEEVSKLTGLRVSCIRNHRYRRVGIPYYKICGCVRYRESEVLNYIADSRVEVSKLNGGLS